MPDTRISELPSTSNLQGSEYFAIVQSGVTKKIQTLNFNSVSSLYDVNVTSVQDGDRLVYSGGTNKWVNLPLSAEENTWVNQSGDTMTGSLIINANLTVTGQTDTTGLTFTYATGHTLYINTINSNSGNSISGDFSTILAGYNNTLNSSFSMIGAGNQNLVSVSLYSFANGELNQMYNNTSTAILTGRLNYVSGSTQSSVLAGTSNTINQSDNSTISGTYNVISNSTESSILSGGYNKIL